MLVMMMMMMMGFVGVILALELPFVGLFLPETK